MAEKRDKKKKPQKISLNDFLSEKEKPEKEESWVTDVSDLDILNASSSSSLRMTSDIPLPTSSESLTGVSSRYEKGKPSHHPYSRYESSSFVPPPVDFSKLPSNPPYIAFIGGLPSDITHGELVSLFAACKITNINLPKDKASGIGRGFGYAEFADRESFIKALECNGKLQSRSGKILKIDIANPDTTMPSHRRQGFASGNERGEPMMNVAQEASAWRRSTPLKTTDDDLASTMTHRRQGFAAGSEHGEPMMNVAQEASAWRRATPLKTTDDDLASTMKGLSMNDRSHRERPSPLDRPSKDLSKDYMIPVRRTTPLEPEEPMMMTPRLEKEKKKTSFVDSMPSWRRSTPLETETTGPENEQRKSLSRARPSSSYKFPTPDSSTSAELGASWKK